MWSANPWVFISMGEVCKLLAFDSEVFGLRIARYCATGLDSHSAAEIDRWCGANDIACVFVFVDGNDHRAVEIAERCGYHLADVRLTFEQSVESTPATPATPGIRAARESDVDSLVRFGRSGFRPSRFYHDSRLPVDKADELHARWIANSVRGYADQVLVVEDRQSVSGFITCHLDPDRAVGTIGLIGVAPESRGSGFGKRLVFSALAWFAQQGAKLARVTTQSRNVAAQRLYQACGFRTLESHLGYHYWPSSPGGEGS